MLLLVTAAVVYTITKGCSKGGRKKSRVERDRERRREGGMGRERELLGGRLAEVITQLSQSRVHCCMSHGEWFIASVSVLAGNSHTQTHTRTRTHLHTAYLVMVQHAAPARTERNWINGTLCATQLNTENCPCWEHTHRLRYGFFTGTSWGSAGGPCLCLSVTNQSMWHYIWQKQYSCPMEGGASTQYTDLWQGRRGGGEEREAVCLCEGWWFI